MHHLFIQSISETTYTNRVRQTTGNATTLTYIIGHNFPPYVSQYNSIHGFNGTYTQSVFFMPECSIGDYREQSLERASVFCFAEYDTGWREWKKEWKIDKNLHFSLIKLVTMSRVLYVLWKRFVEDPVSRIFHWHTFLIFFNKYLSAYLLDFIGWMLAKFWFFYASVCTLNSA